MKELTYTTVGRIFSKLSRDLGTDQFSENDVVEWTGEALEAIDAVTILEECVAFLQVDNFTVQLPKFANSIIQIAEFNDTNPLEDTTEQTTNESSCSGSGAIDDPFDCGNCDPYKYIPVGQDGHPIFDADRYEWKPNINVQAEYINWTTCEVYDRYWTPVRLANHSFFNSIVCEEPEADKLYSNSRSEYTIVGDSTLRFSFQKGYVAIAYTRQKLDDNEYPMIPDHYSYVTAVTKYITMKMMERFWYMGRQGYEQKVAKAESDWQWYCKQASNRALMPKGIDQYQNMLDQSQYLLPRMFRYNQFFKDLGRPETRKFNDPDRRNHPNRHSGLIING